MVYQNPDPAEVDASAEHVDETLAVREQTEETRGRGQTRIATNHGYAFRPNADHGVDFDVTADGVYVTKDQADAIMAEANAAYGDGFVHVVTDDEDDEG